MAHKQIREIENKYSVKINYMPILLGGLFKLSDIKAPAFIPSKAKFMIKDCKLFAEKFNIKFRFNPFFPIRSLNLMRGVLVAKREDVAKKYIDKFFESCWVDRLNINNQDTVDKILKDLGFNLESFKLKIAEQSIKEELKTRTNEAFSKGVFGAPSFIINNKMFWGQDRLEFVLNEAKKN